MCVHAQEEFISNKVVKKLFSLQNVMKKNCLKHIIL